MSNNAFASLLALAAMPIGMAAGMLGVFLVRAFMLWWVTP